MLLTARVKTRMLLNPTMHGIDVHNRENYLAQMSILKAGETLAFETLSHYFP